MTDIPANGEQTDSPANGKQTDLPAVLVMVFCLFVLSFIAGATAYAYKVFPYTYLRNAYTAVNILYQMEVVREGLPYFLWAPAVHDGKGVTIYDRTAAFPGLTLIMSTDAQEARLVDMEGETVHRWARRFSEVWKNPTHLSKPLGDDYVFWRAAQVFPNGDLLVIYVGEGSTPWGYGLAKLDKDSNVIWTYSAQVHHDLTVGPDGRIYTLVHEMVQKPNALAPDIPLPYIDDFLVVLSPDGKELERVSILEALAKSDYPGVLPQIAASAAGKGDAIHTNAVELVRKRTSSGGLTFEPGQVIISMRNLSSIALLDLKTKRVEWLIHGGWQVQHDPDLLENGHIMLFDNRGNLAGGGASRILEFDPATGAEVWQYTGSDEAPFYSPWRGRQQKLPNGNLLITESSGGRLFEVTPDKKIVWEYVTPVRGGKSQSYTPWITGGQRLAREELPFLDGGS